MARRTPSLLPQVSDLQADPWSEGAPLPLPDPSPVSSREPSNSTLPLPPENLA